MRKNFSLILMSIILLFAFNCTSSPHEEAINEAINSAESWLQMIDEGNYPQSWDESAGFFRSAIEKADWNKAMVITREPLGRLISRTVKSAKYLNTLPGAPDGEYVVIQFNTEFENKKNAVETVTPLKDSLGKWRVSGYYIN